MRVIELPFRKYAAPEGAPAVRYNQRGGFIRERKKKRNLVTF